MALIVTAVGALSLPAAPAQPKAASAPVSRAAPAAALPSGLTCIRRGESGGDYRVRSPGGAYSGAYQYDASTWALFGGYGRAGDAPPAVQDAKALDGYSQGPAARHRLWPVTSRRCGV